MNDVQGRLVGDFLDLGDELAQYSYLIELSARLPEAPESFKIDERLVEGCQSSVWLDVSCDDAGILHLQADSDTILVRGLLYVLTVLFDGRSADEAADFTFTLLDDTSLRSLFSQSRRDGVQRIVKQLKACAQTALE